MDLEVCFAMLDERTKLLQRDVYEIKSALARVGIKLDGVKDTVGSVAERVAAVESKLDAKATTFDAKLNARE